MSIMKSRDLVWLISAIVLFGSLFVGPASAHHGEDGGHEQEGEQEGKHVNLRARSLILVKVYCLIITFVTTFIPGISPYFFRINYGFLVLGIQFAGGVFLATALVHFLADANETFHDLTSKGYPFAFMLACCGYLLTAIADAIILTVLSRHSKTNHTADEENGKDAANRADKDEGQANHVNHFIEVNKVIPNAPIADAVLLIIALCFHSVFEGIAIGISATIHDAWRNLWTIQLHKLFAAIGMGIALLKIVPNRPLLSCAAYSFAFALSSPVGIAIGIIIDNTSQGRTADWIYAITMGLATGIFVYVAINHLLAKGFTPPDNRKVSVDTPLYKLVAFALGLAVLFVVLIWD
ncbi:hypothetical protein R1sor_000142 [Riccia sorocarpa]|uniref:Zinc transporter n=1 Tax=Riccia sorocarpa TaxID=122646 RepID=A0ABD3GVI2_9MARC